MDIFAAAGLRKPDISVLSDEFLSEVQGMPHRNLAVELLEKLLKGEVSIRRRKNVVQARSFAKLLEKTLSRYQNRAIEAAQVIEELIALARDMREANARGEQLGLSEDELAFYDALETNDSAVQVLGDDTLRDIARELVDTVRTNVTIDWTLRENVRANLRRLVPPHPPPTRLPARQAGTSHQDSPRTSRSPLPRLGHRLTSAFAAPQDPALHCHLSLRRLSQAARSLGPRIAGNTSTSSPPRCGKPTRRADAWIDASALMCQCPPHLRRLRLSRHPRPPPRPTQRATRKSLFASH